MAPVVVWAEPFDWGQVNVLPTWPYHFHTIGYGAIKIIDLTVVFENFSQFWGQFITDVNSSQVSPLSWSAPFYAHGLSGY